MFPCQLLQKEEERHAGYWDEGADYAFEGDGLLEEPPGGEDYDDGGKRHEGAGDAGAGVLHGKQWTSHAHEGSEDGSEGCHRHAGAVGDVAT